MLNNRQALFARNAYARSLLSIETESSGGSRIVVKGTARAGQRGKSIEQVVAYALGHRIRVYVLTLLNEGTYTPNQLARLIGEPTNKVSHHIKELLEAGSIELVKTEKVRNADQHYYRAVEMPFYSDELAEKMTPQERKVTAGLTLQCMIAEAMSAFWAGKLHQDPRVWLAWRWFNVDEQGRQDIADEEQRSWERMQEIEAESTNRRAESGEEAASIIVAGMGFERERSAPRPPAAGANAE
jgi:DNA-binding transcriptional ArsR family regulator